MTRKPGNLLGVVWVGIFRRKRPVRRTALFYDGVLFGRVWDLLSQEGRSFLR